MKNKSNLVNKLRANGVDVSSIESVEHIKWLIEHPSFERYPVDVKTFIESKKYLGAEKCRKAVMEKMVKIFGTKKYVDKNPKRIMKYKEVVDVEGIGSGKTYSASLFTLYGTYRLSCLKSPQEYYGKSKSSGLYFMLMSTSEKNARDVIFGEITARIEENPDGYFAQKFQPDDDIKTQLNFPKRIKIIPGNSSEQFFVGYNIFMAIIDECDDHKKTKDKDYVEEGHHAIMARITSRFPRDGGAMMIGSPKSDTGFMLRMYEQSKHDPAMLGIHMPTWEALDPDEFSGDYFTAVDPFGKKRKIPIEYKRDWDKNPERFWRDTGAMPSKGIEVYITLPERIERCYDGNLNSWDGKGALPSIRGSGKKEYICHVDLGVNRDGNDHCGLCIGHIKGMVKIRDFDTDQLVERPYIVNDFVARLSAKQGHEIQISWVRSIIMQLYDLGFKFDRVQFDGWQSKDSQQILEKKGITTEQVSVDRDLFAYESLKEAIYDKRINFPKLEVEGKNGETIEIIKEELSSLQRVKSNKVDHPLKGSKDVSDAMAGVAIGLTTNTRLHKMKLIYSAKSIGDNLNIENLNGKKTQKTPSRNRRRRKTAVPRISKTPNPNNFFG